MRVADILSEAAQFPPVTFQQVMTPDYIESIFTTGGLHSGYPHAMATTNYHPERSDNYEGWERFIEDQFPDLDGDAKTLLNTPKVRNFLLKWLPKRWKYVTGEMREIATVEGNRLHVHRVISCRPEVFEAILNGANGLGEYWSYHPEADIGAPWGNDHDRQLFMAAWVDIDRVDWITTMRRNMDYLHGDEESEIFLPHGTPVTLYQLSYDRNYGQDEIQQPNRTT